MSVICKKPIDTKTENFKQSLKTIQKEAVSFGNTEEVQELRNDVKDIKDPFGKYCNTNSRW